MGIHRDPALGFVVLALGLVALALLGWAEQKSLEGAPWYDALFAPEGAPLWSGTMKTYATRIPIENFPELSDFVDQVRAQGGAEAVDQAGIQWTERLVALEAPDETFAEMLSWGRIPQRGEAEVLAGVFTRLDTFRAGERDYTVVGGIERSVAGLHFAYVFPYRESDEVVEREWTAGWLDPNGGERLRGLEAEPEDLDHQTFVGGMHPALPARAWAIVGALILVAAGGALIQLRLFVGLAHKPMWPMSSGFVALREGRSGLVLIHFGLYATFFAAMAVGLAEPVWQLHFAEMVGREFSEGSLGYIGRAYLSQNIPLAAVTTFLNNYVLQTVGLTFLPSLVVPFFAVLKTAVTFGFAGFALTPLWAETAKGFTYHSITMTLELEAYVLVTYGACIYAINLFRSVRDRSWEPVLEGFKVFASLTLLAGIALAVAAVYEAATLILLS